MPASLLQAQMSKNEEWSINNISNLALLQRAGELKNNVQTFDVMLQDKLRPGEISAEEAKQQQLDYEEQLLCPARLLPKPLNKGNFESFLLERFELLKRRFIEVWRDHIPADPQV